MTLEELSNKLYESKVVHDYKDGKIDYRKVHEFIVGLNETLTIPDVSQSEQLCQCQYVDEITEYENWCRHCEKKRRCF